MAREIKIPEVGESVQEVQLGQWLVGEGQWVAPDQDLVEIETDKASLALPAPAAGVVSKILKQQGDPANVGDVVAYLEEQPQPDRASAPSRKKPQPQQEPEPEEDLEREKRGPEEKPERQKRPRPETQKPARRQVATKEKAPNRDGAHAMPAARRLRKPKKAPDRSEAAEQAEAPRQPAGAAATAALREEEAVPMSPIRRRIAKRLLEAQHTAALLTTFNEIDMTAVNELRAQFREPFQEKYSVKLGLMSFFVKASVEALKRFPQVNAEIRGDQMIFRNYYDIGFAVGGGKGLVVPVLRNAELMSFAEIERSIDDMAQRARDNKIQPEELSGGTFTITNGGVFGSLLSTPIVNPPQSAILGLHAIQDRPVARDGQVVIRPMMYVALTYDHRGIDGQAAVSFLRRIKEIVESPLRILLEI